MGEQPAIPHLVYVLKCVLWRNPKYVHPPLQGNESPENRSTVHMYVSLAQYTPIWGNWHSAAPYAETCEHEINDCLHSPFLILLVHELCVQFECPNSDYQSHKPVIGPP